jgi:hypothetical protein
MSLPMPPRAKSSAEHRYKESTMNIRNLYGRRNFLSSMSGGFAGVALSQLLSRESQSSEISGPRFENYRTRILFFLGKLELLPL